MDQPEGYVHPGKKHQVCRLHKSIYGFKQSPRCWNQALDDYLKKMGFAQTSGEPCVYIFAGSLILAVYVDDLVLGERSQHRINATWQPDSG